MTTTTHQQTTAQHFHRLHEDLLVLPNAWDAASARVVAAAGAAAVATTSAGVAWSHGVRDGGGLTREVAVAAAARVVSAVPVPVTIDLEDGYDAEPGGVEATIEAVLAAGAVGVNIEDSRSGRMVPVPDHARLLRRVLAAVDTTPVRLFVNARVDTFLVGGTGADPVADAVERARAYVDQGVHGIFVPGVVDVAQVAVLAARIPVPLNVMVGSGSPASADLAAVGVRRISCGPQLASAAYAQVEQWAGAMLADRLHEVPAGGSTQAPPTSDAAR